MKVVPDTSVVIDGRVSEYVGRELDTTPTVLVPEPVVGELEAQANDDQDRGLDGLSELQRLAELADTGELDMEYIGDPAGPGETAHAAAGSIDAIIRGMAGEHDATLLTSDHVQAEVAEAKSIPVEYIAPDTNTDGALAIEDFFTDDTMAVHLKTDTVPKAKRGGIADLAYETIRDSPASNEEMREWANEIEASVHTNPDSFNELSEPGMNIIQYEDYRIAVARPPFADGIEITAVRPVAKTTLDDYDFADEFRDRFSDQQRGVLVSGSPGAGKSTFAQAVGEFLNDADYAVKTMEKPRDLQVGDEITQYTELGGSMEKTADSLLLVRPDYTIYDEVRKTDDFETFSDMRLAGVGMVGVVHANEAIDALQRLVGRVELGMIPQIVDTVVYIEAGGIHTVYDVTTEVKVPEGMESEELARPVIQVTNFETGDNKYELYTFNGQVVTSPLDENEMQGDSDAPAGAFGLAENEIEQEIRAITDGFVEIDVQDEQTSIAYVEEDEVSYVIGNNGKRIRELEDQLGIHIDVRSLAEQPNDESNRVPDSALPGVIVEPDVSGQSITLALDQYDSGETVEVHCEGEYIMTATISHENELKVTRGSGLADDLEQAARNGRVHVTATGN
jgi:ATPase